ncbi:putative carboxyl-terminal-processing protease, deltaproteobacterial [Methanosarcina thermophila TM-1]|uniref:Putative carboxyl-terminal-processing protease, deltaproteobacterial n=2 Tax=Methanosarcina thermophila TaxID=2210 RepID=A0A0E3ND25_METTT|nr:putative carboxyl-terminal-processing protease, deltaproteobacterial [Methanosarcina thermophila TM-1]
MRLVTIKLRQKMIKKFTIVTLILSILSITASPALGNNNDETNFLIPEHGYTVDYYRSYGEPVIRASIIGNPELSRGETADLQITIANSGVVEGFKRLNANQNRIPDSTEEKLAEAEMEEEKGCTTAKNIKAVLVSETEYIEVEPATCVQHVEELETGYTATLRYTIKIDSDAPAGSYELLLPLNYQYQANVRTTTADVINLGLTDTQYAREYKTKTETLRIPISIENKPRLEVTNVSGNLAQGESKAIEITYKNTGESVAKDALARIIVMSPLSTEKSIVRLGDIEPGEEKIARFVISADQDALVKNYGINSEIKYIDEDGETSFSENMKVNIHLEATEKKFSITGVAVILIVLIALYQIINVYRKRNKNNENASGDLNE